MLTTDHGRNLDTQKNALPEKLVRSGPLNAAGSASRRKSRWRIFGKRPLTTEEQYYRNIYNTEGETDGTATKSFGPG